MKKTLSMVIPILWITTLFGQSSPCWYDSLRLKNFDANPKLKQDEELFYYRLNKWREKNTVTFDAKPVIVPCSTCLTVSPSAFKAKYIIPVVVHIIHRPSDSSPGDSSNITNAQVVDQIASLNHYFAGLNNNDPRNVNTGIQFCLAQVGTYNNGIYRISSSLSDHYPSQQNMKQLMDLKSNLLPYKDYLHIYVVNEIVDGNGSPSGLQGYATFPGSDPQGVVIRYRRFGNTTTCTSCSLDANTQGKVLAHEVGHFLGLQHTFEGGCSGMTGTTCSDSGDKCCDTPPIPSENSGCSPSPVSSCITGVNAMIENYMDYTNDLCRTIFTRNQAEIMHFTLSTSRSWLVDPMHINDVPLACESFSARFSGINTIMCSRDSVFLTALVYSNMSPKYYWEFKSGNTTIFLDSSDTNTYSWLPPTGYGKYKVILRVKVDSDTKADSIADYIQVIDCGGPIKSTQGNWYFGVGAGLKFMKKVTIPDFSASRPQTINSGEGCISISDTNGNLLFYGGGKEWGTPFKLYDQSHNPMSNDSFAWQQHIDPEGCGSSSQGAVAFPNPTNRKQYLMIHNDANLSPGKFLYSVIDTFASVDGLLRFKQLNRGIKPPPNFNYVIQQPVYKNYYDTSGMVYEQVIAIPKCNGRDYWVITTPDSIGSTSRHLAVYSVDSGQPIKYYSRILTYVTQTQGYIKVSQDGNYIAFGNQVFRFNTSTGMISRWFDIPWSTNSNYQIYGLSFSPNSGFLYYIEAMSFGEENIYQINLSLSNPLANIKKVSKAPSGYFQAMQIGPDGKLYISTSGSLQLAVINYPNKFNSPSSQNPCGFTEDGPYTQIGGIGGTCIAGLPNMVDAKSPVTLSKEIKIVQSSCDSVYLNTSVCCASTYEWDFGDGSTHVYTKEAKHKYSSNGSYTITLKVNGVAAKTHDVKIGMSKIGINGFTVVCDTLNAFSYTTKDTLNPYYEYFWTSKKASITQLPSTPNYASVRWHGNGKLYLLINDIKTGCQSKDSIQIRTRGYLSNNIISVNPSQTPCKIGIDSISGIIPKGVGPGFKYGWIFQKTGANPYMVPGENKRHLFPPQGTTAMYKRVVFDSGCYYESNAVNIINIKNEIGGITGKCGGTISGSNMSLYGSISYSWWESNDSFATDSSLITGANNYFRTFSYTPSPKWARRVVIQSGCTTRSNIVRIDKKVEFEKDLPEKKYICGNGNLAVEIIFDFRTGLEDIVTGESNQYYKIPKGSSTIIAINNHIHANNFNDGDTVFCIQTAPDCGTFTSRKCIIKKSYNYIHFITHPASETKATGTNKLFFAALDSIKGVRWNWQVSSDNSTWFDISGSPDNDSFTLTNLSRCQNARYYRVQAITGCGTTNSNGALLTVTGIGSMTQDYWMKDHWRDSGIERNPDSAYIVESADLWVRNKPDGIKPANLKVNQMIAEGDNYIYYTVRNRGTDTAKNGKLFLYWTWAGTGEEWSRKWKYGPNNMYPSPNTGVKHPMGSEINQLAINLPDIKPGDSTAPDYIKWDYNVPKPTWFIKDNDTTDNKWPTANICLLARIQTCEEPEFGMSYKENKNLHYNVIGNNNIVTRNCWMRYITKPRSMDYVKPINGDNETHDAGTTVISGIRNIPTKYKVCISLINSNYLTKANLYVELSQELKDAWAAGGTLSSGMSWVQDNIYKVTSATACIDSVLIKPGTEGTIRAFVSYKNPDVRFESGEIYPISITQYQYNGYAKVGEAMIEIADNPMPEPIINSETSIFACQWDMGATPNAKYIHSVPLPYSIWDNSNSASVTYQPSGVYYLEPATYLITSTDSSSNTVYKNTLTVESANITNVNKIDTLWFNCDYPDSLDYIKTCENGVMYNSNDQVVSESYSGHYTLDPQEPWYTFVCADSTNCTKYTTQIHFKDIIQVPSSTSNYLSGMYNRSENPCCFIDLTEAECDGQTPLTFGQEIQVYNMNAEFLYQTNLELYGGTNLGFRFCPPQWDTASNVISDWYSIVIRNDECSFCRMDFKCDSLGDSQPFIVLNYPSGQIEDKFNKYSEKSTFTESMKFSSNSFVKKLPTSISVFPNPTTSEVSVKVISTEYSNLTIQLNDALGKKVYSNNFETTKGNMNIKLNLEPFSSGVYSVFIPELNFNSKLVIIR